MSFEIWFCYVAQTDSEFIILLHLLRAGIERRGNWLEVKVFLRQGLMQLKMMLPSYSSCLHLPKARTMGVFYTILEIESRTLCMLESTLPNELHPQSQGQTIINYCHHTANRSPLTHPDFVLNTLSFSFPICKQYYSL